MRISDWSSDVCSSDLIDGDANRSDRRLSVGQTEAEAARALRPAGELGIAGDAGVDQRLAGRRVDDEDAVAPPRQRRRIADIRLGPVQRDRVARLRLRLGAGAIRDRELGGGNARPGSAIVALDLARVLVPAALVAQ